MVTNFVYKDLIIEKKICYEFALLNQKRNKKFVADAESIAKQVISVDYIKMIRKLLNPINIQINKKFSFCHIIRFFTSKVLD